jgi:hypothetical protein
MSNKKKKKTGVKRNWCKKKIKQIFYHLNFYQLNKKTTILTGSLVLVIYWLVVPNKAFSIPMTIALKDPGDVPQQVEKACTLFCQLAKVGSSFVSTKEGKTTLMWFTCMSLAQSAKVLGLVVIPSLTNVAVLIAFMCSATYSVSTIIGGDAIG